MSLEDIKLEKLADETIQKFLERVKEELGYFNDVYVLDLLAYKISENLMGYDDGNNYLEDNLYMQNEYSDDPYLLDDLDVDGNISNDD